VTKTTGSATTVFVYNITGQLIAEYGGSATNGGVTYLTTDHLDSTRVVTDANQSVTARHDYLPFGEDIGNVGGRTTAMGYGAADDTRQKFTSKERDAESGLDCFPNRYYSSAAGRFASVDPTFLSVSGTNPQTLNRYSYVLNNPLRFIDPLGLWELDYREVNNKKGELDHIDIFIRKSKDGDDAATLAKQLGFDPNSKEGQKLAAKIEKALGGGESLQGSKLGGMIGAVFGAAEHGLTAQAKFDIKHPDALSKQKGPTDVQYNDCSMTTCRIAFPQAMGGASAENFGVQQADDLIKGLRSVAADALRTGDVVRYADAQNKPQHFMTVIFTGDDGNTRAFSRSGVDGRFEIVPVDHFNGTNYGSIRGQTGKDTGFYRPPQ
jgi:RHS repeat-associated protein